ncbi:UNVERIFIED_CONTAM: hypothetical protein FKN15_063825 [Acipenser sinensis]
MILTPISMQWIDARFLLCERLAPTALPVRLGPQGAASTDCQQEDMLSIAASEGGEQELAFPSEDVEIDGMSPVVKLSLSQNFYR